MKLDIISDPVCPWCYIGATRLLRAMETRPDHPFEVEWHPFFLNPTMPAGGMDRRAYLEAKFGGKEGAVTAYMPVVQEAEATGLALNLDGIAKTPNTMDAQRLIYWSGVEGRQTPVAMALFRAYFQDGRDIEDPDTLADIADGVGMDAAMVHRLLSTEADRDEMTTRDATFRGMGVNSVPTYLVGGQHAVPGAQPVALWQNVIDELLAGA